MTFGPVTAGSWADWVAAVGTTAAFAVAAVAYARDVSHRRWAQARLVYTELVDVKEFAAGEIIPFHEHGSVSGRGDIAWLPLGDRKGALVIDPCIRITVAIHNGSDEIIGPAWVEPTFPRGAKEPAPWHLAISAMPVPPHGEQRVELWCSNSAFPNMLTVVPQVTFRDSAGRWWRRHSWEPIERARAFVDPTPR